MSLSSLTVRLSIAMLLIVVSMGAALFFIDRHNTQVYYEELSQRLNAPIAMYVTEQQQLISGGQPDLETLATLAERAMVVNPTAEIYLLDPSGRILGHGLTPDSVISDHVNLQPIREFLTDGAELPLRGNDPKTGRDKIFSASEVRSDGALEGYLYVVLGGERYETLSADIGNSYTGRTGALAIAGVVVLAAVTGLLVFSLLTWRLKRLRRGVRELGETGFHDSTALAARAQGGDEIDELARAFQTMSAKIASQISQLEENDRLRRELVTNISHDLRTPLSAIQGCIETMILRYDGMDDTDRKRFLKIASKHSLRLNSLIGDLFELSKLDAGSIEPSVDSFSLPELVQDTAQEFRYEIERKQLTLDIAVDTEHSWTRGDIGLIQRVLENLVRNAVAFTPEGGAIRISVFDRDDSLAVSVADNGPGIPEKDLPRIFDRFYRARDGEEARSSSSGLGLAIVKRILDLHETSIHVESRIDAGTRFEFELPRLDRAA